MEGEINLGILVKRLKVSMNKARKIVKENGDKEMACIHVIPRIDNVARFIRENNIVLNRRDRFTFDAEKYLIIAGDFCGFFDSRSLPFIKENLDSMIKKDLRELEASAKLKHGACGYGICARCGRTLTNPESIARGLGPECAKKNDSKGAGIYTERFDDKKVDQS